ncbi:MAG: hypothetical protein JSV80_07705 [Acidobacteriota bacterium]|nr:MAG: hypothetical protein JSV80_07705 [Acidobacteriota bacterium]
MAVRGSQGGITATELLIVVAVLALIVVVTLPVAARWASRDNERRLVEVGNALFEALEQYRADHGQVPPPGAGAPGGFNLRTLAPLSTDGYVTDSEPRLAALRRRRVSAYDSIAGSEAYWALLVDRDDPDVQVIVASTDAFPLLPDTWLDGVYVLRGERLEKQRRARARSESARREASSLETAENSRG